MGMTGSPARGRKRLMLPAVCAAALLAVAACEEENTFVPPPPPEVTVAQPARQDVVEYLEFTGNTEATETVELRARVKGFLQSVHFEDGGFVKEGQVLFVIDPAEYQAAVASAKAKVSEARAKLERTTKDLARAQTLFRQGNVSEQVLDLRTSDRLQAAAELDSAEAELRQAELSLGYTRVEAPFDGRMGRKLVDVGNLVGAGDNTHLATIVRTDPIYAYFTLNERDLARVRERRRAPDAALQQGQKPPEAALELGGPGDRGFPHRGEFDFADIGVDPNTGTILLRGSFPNPNRDLLPGMFVRIRAPIGVKKDALLVDERAIGADQRGRFVLVVNDENVVQYRSIELGAKVDGARVITGGLDGGERVIVRGVQRAREGLKVSPTAAEGPAGAPVAKSG